MLCDWKEIYEHESEIGWWISLDDYDITPAQRVALGASTDPYSHFPNARTVKGLKDRGMIFDYRDIPINSGFRKYHYDIVIDRRNHIITPLGWEYILQQLDQFPKYDNFDANTIHTNRDLESILRTIKYNYGDMDFSIMILEGLYPMLVQDSNPRNPLVMLSRLYQHKLEHSYLGAKFLTRVPKYTNYNHPTERMYSIDQSKFDL